MTGFTGRLAWQPVGRVAALSVALLLIGGASSSLQDNAVSAAQANLGATPISLPCRDSYEDDGVPSQARAIVIGETQTHLFCPEGDADWLHFFANRGKGYSIETSRLSVGVDTYLNLFAQDGRTLLATNDDAPGAHGPSRIVFYPQEDGWYYVQAKNQGNIGYPGLLYSITLSQVDVPLPTLPTLPTPNATRDVTLAPANIATATRTRVALPLPASTPTAQHASVGDLLHPQRGDGGVDVYGAGSTDGMWPDAFEPDNTREEAKPINVGAVYKYLNFVPVQPPAAPAAPPALSDPDFYSFRVKPGLCYMVQTGDLSSGLDTTLLLWQAVTGKERWKLLAQNDDAHPHTADLSSAIRWCAATDMNVVVEVRNYGGPVATDPRGKSYSLSLLISPPTPTPAPIRVPKPQAPAQAQTVQPGRQAPAAAPVQVPVYSPPLPQPQRQPQSQPTPMIVQPPASTPLAPTPTPTPAPTRTTPPVLATSTMPPTSTSVLPRATPTSVTSSPTATPQPSVSIDVVAYIADASATGPNPGDGIVALPVLLVDVRTNAVIQRTTTDPNGHAQLAWQWQGPVRVSMPAFRWGRALQLRDFSADTNGGTGGTIGTTGSISGGPAKEGGTLSLQARMLSYALPGLYP